MRVYIASDHAGFKLKQVLVQFLRDAGHEIKDMGSFAYEADDDYPDFIMPLAKAVAGDAGARGVILGKSGEGESMAANRVRGARAAVYYGGPTEILKLSREDNDANILSLGAAFLPDLQAKDAVRTWLAAEFTGEARHVRRIGKLDQA